MIKLKEKLAKKKKGSGLLLVMILVFFMITFIVTVGEFYRVHIMQQEIEMHLQRTVNCAVEYAMGDSYRQDKIVNLNVGLAKNKFYKFLGDDMGLDSYNRKYRDGKFIYRLNFTSVNGTSNPAVFTVKGYATARSLFSFSMFVLSGVMYAWLAVRKSDRDRRLPLIPVLTAAYVMTIILGGGVY